LEEIKTDTDRGLTKGPTAGFVSKGCWTNETSRREVGDCEIAGTRIRIVMLAQLKLRMATG